jgi:hypothetical protein
MQYTLECPLAVATRLVARLQPPADDPVEDEPDAPRPTKAKRPAAPADANAPLPAVNPSAVDESIGQKRSAVVAAMRHSWAGCARARAAAGSLQRVPKELPDGCARL